MPVRLPALAHAPSRRPGGGGVGAPGAALNAAIRKAAALACQANCVSDTFPRPPKVAAADVRALVDWMDAGAAWLREDATRASSRGRAADSNRDQMRYYVEAALLLREAYELESSGG